MEQESTQTPRRSMAELLAQGPPDARFYVPDALAAEGYSNPRITAPVLSLWCRGEHCNGTRLFSGDARHNTSVFSHERLFFEILEYTCNNCGTTGYYYSLMLGRTKGTETSAIVIKLGQWPPLRPRLDPDTLALFGPDQEEFLKGRDLEAKGFGVAAFTYYRRVIENQRNRIFDAIADAMDHSGETVFASQIREQKDNNQFLASLKAIKPVPNVLLIDGQSPLLLLHGALSEGVHTLSDDECLQHAQVARVVLVELARRITQLLEDRQELREAVAAIHRRRSERNQSKPGGT